MARTIALVGGGTMGPTAPLFALYDALKKRHPNDRFVWAGTKEGPEYTPIVAHGIPFVVIPSAKFPRYLTIAWLKLPFAYWQAMKASKAFLDEWKPDIVIGTGGFTQVPIMRAAGRRGIPCAIHQLDFVPSLSNKLVSRFCRLITTTFVYHYHKFKGKTEDVRIATPNRFADIEAPERARAARYFDLSPDKPIVFFVGGGTGARTLNLTLEKDLDRWLKKIQIIHATGKGRGGPSEPREGYTRYEFMDEEQMLFAYAAADVVVSRAGMGSITDLSALEKAAVLVPIPNSHQEKNARHIPRGAVVVEQGPDFSEMLYHAVLKLLVHKEDRARLAQELRHEIRTDDGSEWASMIERLLPEDLDI